MNHELCPFEDIKGKVQISYTGEGRRIAREFYIPLLKRAKYYDRISGYFSIDSLVITAAGMAGLIQNGGKMRLVLGAHDFGPELVEAMELSESKATDILQVISERIAQGLDTVESLFEKRRLEAIAWMLKNDALEIRIAIPKKTYVGLGNGIFHEKQIFIQDRDGCVVQAAGSGNETKQGYDLNGENWTVHMSWRPGAMEYVDKARRDIEAIWNNKHPDYYIFDLPEAVSKKIHKRFYRPSLPIEPMEELDSERTDELVQTSTKLGPIAKWVSVLGDAKDMTHMGLGPVRLYPHQAFAADYATTRYPHRVLFADEVGLGKTLEAGAAIRRLLDTKAAERVLILTPKNVCKQWMEEMWIHFRLRFWLLDTAKKRMIDALGNEIAINKNESPFDRPGIDMVVASWHYARRDGPKQWLLDSQRGFDLVIIDEAHAARKKRSMDGKIQPTKMNELCMELSLSSPHIFLLTATPVQLRAIESHDLLRVLGLGGKWAVEKEFEYYFSILQKAPEDCTEIELHRCFELAAEFARGHLSDATWKEIVKRAMKTSDQVTKAITTGRGTEELVSNCFRKERHNLHKLLMQLSPVQWFMVRNTRSKLEALGFKFPKRDVDEEAVKLTKEHEELLAMLDNYLQNQYAAYEKLLTPENRGTIGFVKAIYHQRFVSCFTAAHETIKNRLEFISGLLTGYGESLERAATKLLDEEDLEEDEDDILEAIQELLDNPHAEAALRKEEDALHELLERLAPFAPGNITGADPKLTAVLNHIREMKDKEGRGILVFTKYTDTVQALREFLLSHGFDKRDMAIYTGQGGLIARDDKWTEVSKEDIRRALEGGLVKLVLCTDAASEGLNLQAASAIINVDMPWNPARVEQRIGRVDRLGQKAKGVRVVNVWYPNTIEARMYSVLFDRGQVYKLVVGPAQEIFSTNMRRALDEGATGEKLSKIVKETFDQIDSIKEELQRTQGVLSGASWSEQRVLDEQVVKIVRKFVEVSCKMLGLEYRQEGTKIFIADGRFKLPDDIKQWNGCNTEVGHANALTPSHPIVQWLCETILSISGPEPEWDRSIYLLKDGAGIGTFYISEDEDGIVEPKDIGDVIDMLEDYMEVFE